MAWLWKDHTGVAEAAVARARVKAERPEFAPYLRAIVVFHDALHAEGVMTPEAQGDTSISRALRLAEMVAHLLGPLCALPVAAVALTEALRAVWRVLYPGISTAQIVRCIEESMEILDRKPKPAQEPS